MDFYEYFTIDLCEMFNKPARITESTSSHLYVFLTNSSFSFDDVFAVPVGFSDHHVGMGTYVRTYLAGRSHQLHTHKVINFMLEVTGNLTLLCYLFYLQMNPGMLFFLSVMLMILYSVLPLYCRDY